MSLADLQKSMDRIKEIRKRRPKTRPATSSAYGLLQQRVGKPKAKELLVGLRQLQDQDSDYDEVSLHDLYPETATIEIMETQDTFAITTQKSKVDAEKHMISDEGIIPASVSNQITKITKKIKNIFHKDAPTAITLTKRTETENRNLWDTYSEFGTSGLIVGGIILYLIIKGK